MTDEVLERIMARINNVSLILPIDEKNHRYGIMVPIRTLKQILYEERDEKNCSVFKLQEEKAEEYVIRPPLYDGYSLHKENEDLKKNLARYSEKIYEQEAQIERMKNVGNCEHALNCARWVQQHITSNEVTCCKGCSEWELTK